MANLDSRDAPRRRETPLRRRNPSGTIVFVARWTDRNGKRQSAGTFTKRGPCRAPGDVCCAQHAIEQAYAGDGQGPRQAGTVALYRDHWLNFHRDLRTVRGPTATTCGRR